MNIFRKLQVMRNQRWLDKAQKREWLNAGRDKKTTNLIMNDLDLTLEEVMEDIWRTNQVDYLGEARSIKAEDFRSPIELAKKIDKKNKDSYVGFYVCDMEKDSNIAKAYEKKYLYKLRDEQGNIDEEKVDETIKKFKECGFSQQYIQERNSEIEKMYNKEVKRRYDKETYKKVKNKHTLNVDNAYVDAFKNADNLYIHEEGKVITIEFHVYYWDRYQVTRPEYIREIHPIYNPKYFVEDEETKVFMEYLIDRQYPGLRDKTAKEYYISCNQREVDASYCQRYYAWKSVQGKQYIRESLSRLPKEIKEKYKDYSFFAVFGFHNILTNESFCSQFKYRIMYEIEHPERIAKQKDGSYSRTYDPKGDWSMQGMTLWDLERMERRAKKKVELESEN